MSETIQRQAPFTFFPLASQYWAAQPHIDLLKTLKCLLTIYLNILNTSRTTEWFLSLLRVILAFLYLSRLYKTSQFFHIIQWFWDRWKKIPKGQI